MKNAIFTKLKMALPMLLIACSTMATNTNLDSTNTHATASESTLKIMNQELIKMLITPSSELLGLSNRQVSLVYTTDDSGNIHLLNVSASHPALHDFIYKRVQNKPLKSGNLTSGQRVSLSITFK